MEIRKHLFGWAGLALALVVVLALGALWWRSHGREDVAQKYRNAAVRTGAITQTVSANGTLNPVVLVNVGTQVSGTVAKLHVDFNDRVKAGQVLLELDPSVLRAQLAQSEANLRNARAALELARANERRSKSLFDQDYIARQDYDQAVHARESAEAQVALAEAQVKKDRTNLGYSIIRSPVSGVVVNRTVDVGQTVAASFQTPTLFQIAQDLRKMQIDSNFAEADIGAVKVGQPVRFTVDAFPDRTFRGSVRQVRLNATVQQNVVTYDVVVAVDNPEEILLPGMTAYVNIIVARRDDVLLVPNAALRFRPEPARGARGGAPRAPGEDGAGANRGRVYVIADDSLREVPVETGITNGRVTEVTSGALKDGDAVVTGLAQAASEGRPSSFRMRLF